MRRDGLLAAGLLAAAVMELLLREPPRLALQLAACAAITLAVALRGRSLPAALAIQVAAFSALSAATVEPEAVAAIPALLACLFTAGSALGRRDSVLAVTFVSAAVWSNAAFQEGVGDAIYVTVVFVLPGWVAGRLMRSRRRQVEELERLNRVLAAERERAEALAAQAERVRIAREMHDVLSHGMSLMVLQAGAGPALLQRDPAAAAETFRSIRRTGERAREELAAALADREDRARDLESLVAAVPGARLRQRGDLAALAPGVRLAVQRIVQEALTNAVKHGGGTAEVEVVADGATVELRVCDEGGAGHAVAGSGRGLVGMHERAAAYGGTLHAAPRPGGGYEVRARIPAHPA